MGSLEPTVATWDTDDGTKPNKRRGRKQNDSLPPSRSRDAQRAFRARRAEKLAWLEARIVDLEMENADFRRRLGLPAAQRPTAPHAASPLLSPMPRDGARPEEKVFKLDRGDSSRPHVSPPPRASTSAWMPSPAPIYLARSLPQPIMRHSAPRSNPSGGSPSVIDSGEMSDDEEHSRLLEFCGVRTLLSYLKRSDVRDRRW